MFLPASEQDASEQDEERRQPPSAFWLLLLAVAVVELLALPVRTSRVATPEDFQAAASFVRSEYKTQDAISVAPEWADPWLRWSLGDRISLADAGRSDLAAYSRLWMVSLRGHDAKERPAEEPELDRLFGRVRVRRWPLPKPSVDFDFARNVRGAKVFREANGQLQECPWQTVPAPRRGGLGTGVLFPTERFVCEPRRPWLFVAPVVLEDLDLNPRYCLWQHPQGREPIVARFDNVRLQDEVVFEGGLYYEHERDQERGPVHVKVRFNVGGAKGGAQHEDAGRLIHSDGDGWKRLVIDTRDQRNAVVNVSVEVSADNPHLRSFCWNATTRTADTVRRNASR